MLSTFLAALRRRFQLRSLNAKLLLPIAGLMLVSLLGSTLAFVIGTALTQSQLLAQQATAETERVSVALAGRAEAVANASDLLANDPGVFGSTQEEGEAALKLINSRAVVVRDRLGVDLIQIYDGDGQARANLVLSTLYRESSLLDLVAAGAPVVRVVGGQPLLLSRTEMPEGAGTVIAGIDLETELQRLAARYRLTSELGLSFEGTYVSTSEVAGAQGQGRYTYRLPLTLGDSTLELWLLRSTADITRVTNTGLRVMIASTLLTMLLLMGLSVGITRSIARPVKQLSAAAAAVAQGDLSGQVGFSGRKRRFGIGNQDEIGLLARAFDSMVAELRSLYGSLEAKVQARTHELATAAEVARAVSSSLNLDLVLHKSVELIYDRLGFYHVAIFIADPGVNAVVLHEALGEGGDLFEDQGLRITVGSRSLVGVAAATGEPCVAQDVQTEPAYLQVPQLPDTQSEAAIPLLVGETILGVLDVQSRHKGAFPPEMVELLTALADQIATGMHNATLYASQRKTAEHLAEADRLKDQFLANISHELRTPLNSIIGFSRMLLKGMSGPLSEDQAQDVTFIHESGRHLLRLVNDILDISRINAGEVRLSFEQVNVGHVLGMVLDSAVGLVADKPVSIVQEIDPHLPPIRADEQRVQQILLNLLSNATKFTDAGQITARARMVEVLNPASKQLEPVVEISISDTGIGIPADKMEDIFHEFIQADNSDSRRFQGTGLGLAIAKKLVELHGGRIWAESQVGQGSTFTIIMPASTQSDVNSPSMEQREIREEIAHVA